MKLLADFKQSLIWHVVTGKYEVTDKGELRKRKESELKDSGVEWIGKIPKGWGTRRLKDIGEIKRGTYLDPINFTPEGFPHLNGGKFSNEKTSQSNSDEKDITISTIGNSVGSVNWPQGRFWAGNNCTKITSKNPREAATILKTFEYDLAKQANTSAQPFIQSKRLENFIVPHLPRTESQKILSFLSSLDTLIPATDGVLKLINDWYQSTVWHVVTGKYEVTDKGELRKRKESEMHSKGGWSVPKSWDVVRIKDIAKLCAGGTPNSNTEAYYTQNKDGYDWIQVCDIKGGEIKETSKQVTDTGKEFTRTIPENSVVMAMYASVGKCGWTTQETEINQAVLGITPVEPSRQMWIFHTLQMQEDKTASLGRGGTQNNTNASICKNISIPWPPENESQKILAFLESLSKKVDKLKENL